MPDLTLRKRAATSWMAECYTQMIAVSVLQIMLLIAFPEIAKLPQFLCVINGALLVSLICMMKRFHAPLCNPISAFAVIWIGLIPATSFSAPLMPEMNAGEWMPCCIGVLVFSIGGLILSANFDKREVMRNSRRIKALDGKTECILIALIGISIAALAVNFLLTGEIALFSEDYSARKIGGAFPGYSFLSSLGSIGVTLLASAKIAKRRKTFVVFTVVYLLLQTLTGQRFVAILTMLMAVSLFASSKLERGQLKKLAAVVSAVLLVFLFVSSFRGGSEDKTLFFINTGIYSGSVDEMTSTELLRYVGMSQRNMSIVMDQPFDPALLLEYSLSPITSLFKSVPTGLGTSVSGYTANNIIAYFYHDAGALWWVLMLLWSLSVNALYFRFLRSRSSLINSYLWALASLSILLSFFAYVNAYVYWVLQFPLLVLLLDSLLIGRSRRAIQRSESNRHSEARHKASRGSCFGA